MKTKDDIDNIYNEETPIQRIPNDGLEEIQIEPINIDDMQFHILNLNLNGLNLLAYQLIINDILNIQTS